MFSVWRLTAKSVNPAYEDTEFEVVVNPIERIAEGVKQYREAVDIPALARWSVVAALAGIFVPSTVLILIYALDGDTTESIARRKVEKMVAAKWPEHTIDWNQTVEE